MLPAFVIGVREGLETVVILGAIVLFLRTHHREDLLRPIWRACVGAAVLSVGAGLLVRFWEINLGWRQQEQLETVVGFAAVAMVTYMVVWMRRFPKDLGHDSASAAAAALAQGAGRALVGLAFFAVLREGFEIVVFVVATVGLTGDNSSLAAGGALLGVLAALAVGVGIVRGSRHLDVARFFRVTALVLVLSAAGIAMTTVHSANAAGWVTFGQSPQFDLSWLGRPGSLLSTITSGMFGFQSYPVLIELVTWFAYLVPMSAVVLWPIPRPADARATPLATKGPTRGRWSPSIRSLGIRWAVGLGVVVALGGIGIGVAVTSGPTAAPPPAAAVGRILYATLEGVACPSATRCVGVGEYLPVDRDGAIGDPDGDGRATHTLVETADGGGWQRVPSPDAGKGGAVLAGIACPSVLRCVAVGYYRPKLDPATASVLSPSFPLVETFDGTAWRVEATPEVAPNSELAAVSCPTAASCVAVGTTSSTVGSAVEEVAFAERLDAVGRHPVALGLPKGTSTGLTDVDCSSATSCVAVGSVAPDSDPGAARPLLEASNGLAWHVVALPSGTDGRGILYAITCPEAGRCVAVGNTTALRRLGSALVIRSAGTRWTVDRRALAQAGDAVLNSVVCTSVASCVVSGNSALSIAAAPVKVLARLDSSGWQPLDPSIDGGNVAAIACLVVLRCVGVGSLPTNTYGNTTTLIASLGSDGWERIASPKL